MVPLAVRNESPEPLLHKCTQFNRWSGTISLKGQHYAPALARAVAADNADRLFFLDLERDVLQHPEFSDFSALAWRVFANGDRGIP